MPYGSGLYVINMNHQLFSFLFAFTVFQGAMILLALIVRKKANLRANRLLALLVFCYVLLHAQHLYLFMDWYKIFPYFIWITNPLYFVVGPLFYYYITFLLDPHFKFRWYHVFHLSLFFYTGYTTFQFFQIPLIERIGMIDWLMYSGDVPPPTMERALRTAIFRTHPFIYSIFAFQRLKAFERSYKLSASGTIIHFIRLVKNMVLVFSISMLATVVFIFIIHAWELKGLAEVYVTLFHPMIIYFIAIVAMTRPESLFHSLSPNRNLQSLPVNNASTTVKDLMDFMIDKKPYLDPDLRLHELANQMNISPDQLSQLLNQEIGKNFFSFINEYRVHEFKKRLADPSNRHLTLLGIGYSSGFNSKASFNRVFKQFTGQTPKDFVSQNKN